MASNSKYTNPTGPGYAGVYSADGWGVEISIGATQHVDWRDSDHIVAADLPNEAGIQLVHRRVADDSEVLQDASVGAKGMGTIVRVHPETMRDLAGFEPGDDVRVYEFGEEGLTIVPRDTDPFVGDGGER